jgi:hypothetical protein
MKYSMTTLVLLCAIMSAFAQTSSELDTTRWILQDAAVTEFLGKKCLLGTAFLKEIVFSDGVLEADIAVSGGRSYPGLVFRKQNDSDYERVYLRPHLPKTFTNVVQYVASFNGIDSWQLYNGDGYTAAAEIPLNTWFHLRLEVKGTQARVLINNAAQPVLFIRELAHQESKGAIGIMGPKDGSAYFCNFTFSTLPPEGFPEPIKTEPPQGMITEWELSNVFQAGAVDMEKTPAQQPLSGLTWQKIKSLPSGLVDVSRYYGRQGAAPDLVWAKTKIESNQKELRQYAFGYSDYIMIFLNGQPLFNAGSAYQQRDPTFQGIVGLHDYIYLPLKKGDNELVVAVAESFGGWAFIFQDAATVFQHAGMKKVWELPRQLKYPESVVYDAKRDLLYVSNYFNDRKEFISILKIDGAMVKREGIPGILQPTGLCIYQDRLYAVGRYALIEIDLQTNEIVKRYPFPQPRFPNDVSADQAGNLYITDSQKKIIWKWHEGAFEEWLQLAEDENPNGILVDGDILLYGASGSGVIKKVNLNDKSVSTLVSIGSGAVMDGLQCDGKGGYLISDYNGRIFRISKGGQATLLLNGTAAKKFCADFAYLPDKKLLIIPSLEDNNLTAWKLADE